MNIFNRNSGDFMKVDLKEFFEEVRKNAMDSGYDLLKANGLEGLEKDFGSNDPVGLANKLMTYFIKYEEYEKCAVLKKLIEEYNKTCQTK